MLPLFYLKTNIFAPVKTLLMIYETRQQKGLAVVAELLGQVARLHDKNLMQFFERAEYVRPSHILNVITDLAASQLSSVLGMGLKWRLLKKVGHLYSLDKALVADLNGYIDAIGFDRFESQFATWHRAALGMAPIAHVQGWIALMVLSKASEQMNVGEIAEEINAVVRREQIFRDSTLGKPELRLIQQPATTQLLKRFVALGLVGTERHGKFSYHFIADRSRLFFLASLGEQYADWQTAEKPVKKKTTEEILIV